MKKYIIIGILFLMIVSGGLLLITQQSNDSIENYIIEDRSSLDISASESETILDISLRPKKSPLNILEQKITSHKRQEMKSKIF